MKRNQYTIALKQQVFKEAEETANKSLVTRLYKLSANMVDHWCQEFHKGKLGDVSLDQVDSIDTKHLAEEIGHLKKLLGEKDLEIDVLGIS
ncbi:transposase [Halobacillus shinanisalinarum]|uniref:Transposase n=1 Tax=Halobacillus shinanisalinarum TaxID=2932258 RepID=A0ABY4GWX5_9BACI|nr:transposase [Halobacillus shinanisalinarum]UOQ92638.1 transposase [Halobacillus shinanisalinarum]